jgi:hypothetical protein
MQSCEQISWFLGRLQVQILVYMPAILAGSKKDNKTLRKTMPKGDIKWKRDLFFHIFPDY